MKIMNVIKEVSYKGHTIIMFEDGFHQQQSLFMSIYLTKLPNVMTKKN
jgi:hypothetical protein